MGDRTGIEWTDATWNPLRGCSRVSEGCRHCYAEVMASRFSGPGQPYEGLATRSPARWTGVVQLVEAQLVKPLQWTRPRRIFVNSMSDLFHERAERNWIAGILGVVARAQQHTFQALTKRPALMLELMTSIEPAEAIACMAVLNPETCRKPIGTDEALRIGENWPPRNLWLGVSVEDQATAEERIPLLLQTPAAVRFVSYEPALGPVDFSRLGLRLCKHWKSADSLHAPPWCPADPAKWWWEPQALRGARQHMLDWIIVGGESKQGPDAARPFDIEWARSTIAQCSAAGVACFVKQLGEAPVWYSPDGRAGEAIELKDSHGGDWDEWPADLRVREFPSEAA